MEACLLFFTTFSFFLISSLPLSLSLPDKEYLECPPSLCGRVGQIYYPFWSDEIWQPLSCRRPGFQLHCPQDGDHYPTIQIHSQTFIVTDIDPVAYKMRLVRTDFVYDNCSSRLTNTSVSTPLNLFHYEEPYVNVTLLYECPQDSSTVGIKFPCQPWRSSNPNSNNYAFYPEHLKSEPRLLDLIKNCKHHVQLPVSIDPDVHAPNNSQSLQDALSQGFRVQYGFNESPGMRSSPATPGKGSFSLTNKVIVGVVTATVVVLVMLTLFYFYQRRKKNTSYAKSYILSRTASSVSSKMTMDPEINASKYFGVPVFTYAELEEATNNFDSAGELGDGGFGTVYFGRLQDGRQVAVKRLYENNYKRVEQFINEVQILTRLRHVNLVSLYGCTSRRSRELLLVYEYIPNGTLADHLHGDRARPGSLSWNIRINIAIETASALAYLHSSDIIHRDVKTNNILLDNHFVVKVADFGLSRLFPDDVTHISTAPQGTPGYVDPEYHECYQLTVKSDVYSFGVVLIELISSLPAVDITRHRHEINLSTMAINKIQHRALHELVDPALGFESDQMVRKMINAVAELAFQCLQNLKDMRPSMEEVLETLKDIESDGKHRNKAEVMEISADDDVGLHKKDLPPPSPDSNLASKSTTTNSSSR